MTRAPDRIPKGREGHERNRKDCLQSSGVEDKGRASIMSKGGGLSNAERWVVRIGYLSAPLALLVFLAIRRIERR